MRISSGGRKKDYERFCSLQVGASNAKELAHSQMADEEVRGDEANVVFPQLKLSCSENVQPHVVSSASNDEQIALAGSFSGVDGSVEKNTATCARQSTVVLVLVGLPGSGKSTFCSKVMQSGGQRWTRICQDIIANGKQGSKGQCLQHAERALKQCSNVVIDRCNISKEQRFEFVELARKNKAEVHALFLDLPVKLCIQRAIQRTGHEGGLQGRKAPAAIQRIAQNKECPHPSEGFTLITHCLTDSDVGKAVALYQKLDGVCDTLSILKVADLEQKLQGSMWPFLHNVKVCSDVKTQEGVVDETKFDDTSDQKSQKNVTLVGDINEDLGKDHVDGAITERQNNSKKLNSFCAGKFFKVEDVRTLAFPSISTSDFQFDHEKAANILIENVSKFLQKYEQLGLRLVFVDLNENSDMLSRVREKAAAWGLDSKRFFTFAGDITKLYSGGGLHCNFIANPTNWRLKAGGGGVNGAIFKAAGDDFEIETKKRAKTLSPGSSLVVPLSTTSPLRRTEGVTHVIHVLGPNMNPSRPNCLLGDYLKGCEILNNAYLCVFEEFASSVQSQLCGSACDLQRKNQEQGDANSAENTPKNNSSSRAISDSIQDKPLDAFALLMQSSKRKVMSNREGKLKREREWTRENSVLNTAFPSCGPENPRQGTNDAKIKGAPREYMLKDLNKGVNDNIGTATGCEKSLNPKTKESKGESREDQQWGSEIVEAKASKSWGTWAQALRIVALHPEQHEDTVLEVTDEAVVVYDLYPKGKKHLLVVARENGLDSITDLRSSHVPLLQHMHTLGQTWARHLQKEDASLVFRLGYHSDPSMRQLHMHVISQDFDSHYLKNKKHWNSFTTNFFRDSIDVINELEKTKRVKPCGDEGSLFKTELRCHRCRSVHPNLPRLKNHIHSCQVPFSSALMEKNYFITKNFCTEFQT